MSGKTPFQRVTDALTDGCGCACHTGTGYRTSCEHCFALVTPSTDALVERALVIARTTIEVQDSEDRLALREPDDVVLARGLAILHERLGAAERGRDMLLHEYQKAERRAEDAEDERDGYLRQSAEQACEAISWRQRAETAEAKLEQEARDWAALTVALNTAGAKVRAIELLASRWEAKGPLDAAAELRAALATTTTEPPDDRWPTLPKEC